MQILTHAKDLIPLDRRDAEPFEAAIATLVLLFFPQSCDRRSGR